MKDMGGIVVKILHHVHQLHDVCIFVPMTLFGENAAWVHQAHDTEQLNLFYMMIGIYSACGVNSFSEQCEF